MRLSTLELATLVNDATDNWCGVDMALKILRVIQAEAAAGRLPKDLEFAVEMGKEVAHAARQKVRG